MDASDRRRVVLGFDHFARYVAGLAQGLAAVGWEPAVYYREHGQAFGGTADGLDRFLATQLPAGAPRFRIRGRVRDVRALRSVGAASRALRRWRPDVVHVQHCVPNDPRIALGLGLRPGRFALTVHDAAIHPGDHEPRRHQRVLVDWLARHAAVVFVHGETLREQVLRVWEPRGAVVVVPHGIAPADLGPLPDRPSLLFFGRLSEYKGLRVLLDALPAVWSAHPDATLTIAGEGDLPRHPALEDRRVRLLHRYIDEEEVPELFAAASLVVLPYIEASQSGVGSLAKGYGRPLLATAVGGLVELVADGSGELAPPGDPDALAARIVALLGDRARLAALAAAGRRSAAESSSWRRVAEITADAYERHLLGPRRDGARRPA